MALRGSGYFSTEWRTVSGTTHTFYIYGINTTDSCNYWVFDEPTTSSVSHGMRVWNSSGSLCFDSGLKYLKLIDFKVADEGGGGLGPWDSVYPSGKTYATVTAASAYIESAYTYHILLNKWSSNTMTSEFKLLFSGPSSGSIGDTVGKLMVIDVTGL
jgi:hypothetical protein